MSPLSTDPEKRARQLANLRRAPAAPAGHQRSLVHGGHSARLVENVEAEVFEIMEAIGESVPVRESDGTVPPADWPAIETAARALKRYRHLSMWCDLHGRLNDKEGTVKPAATLELRAERALAQALDVLGMNPRSRASLGVDLARARDLAQEWASAANEESSRAS